MRTESEWAEKYADAADSDTAVCLVCHWAREIDAGESTPDGLVCAECLREEIACANCGDTAKRAEFYTGDGFSSMCSDCDYARDRDEACQ